jgi:hypothetical protein
MWELTDAGRAVVDAAEAADGSPVEPAWVLDTAESVMALARDGLIASMLANAEDPTDTQLWRLRWGQFRALLASERLIAVRHWGSGTR